MLLKDFIGIPLLHKIDIKKGEERPFPTDDNVGIEIELENIRLKKDITTGLYTTPLGWTIHTDGSLRNGGVEFVFDGPISGYGITLRLESLLSYIKEYKLKPECSPRTSVHVHVDARDLEERDVFKWLMIYCIYEPLLFEAFAPERAESNFCVPIYNSLISQDTISYLKAYSWGYFFKLAPGVNEHRRYAAVNLVALNKFSSLEFRHLSGTFKPKPIIDWVSALLSLKGWVRKENSSLESLFTGPSKVYAEQLTVEVFAPEIAERLLNIPNFDKLFIRGVRVAQNIYLDKKLPKLPSKISSKVDQLLVKKKIKNLEEIKNHVKALESSFDITEDTDDFFNEAIDDSIDNYAERNYLGELRIFEVERIFIQPGESALFRGTMYTNTAQLVMTVYLDNRGNVVREFI